MGTALSVLPQSLLANGYTPTPNDYYDVLPSKVAGLTQWFVIGQILRHSVGEARRKGTPPPEWASGLTIKTLAEKLDKSPRAILEAIDDAVERGLIAKRRNTQDGRNFDFQAKPQKWATAPKYTPPQKPATNPPEEADAGPLTIVKPDAPLMLLPGKTSRPIPLKTAIREVIYQNSGPSEIRIGSLERDGAIVVQIGVIEKGEEKANQPNLSQRSQPSQAKTTCSAPHIVSSGINELSHFSADIGQLQEYLTERFDVLYGKNADAPLVWEIASRLAATPVEAYINLCNSELDRRGNKRKPGSGLFLNWADDAKAAHDSRQMRRTYKESKTDKDRRETRIEALMWLLTEANKDLPEILPADWKETNEKILSEAAPAELAEAKRRIKAKLQ